MFGFRISVFLDDRRVLILMLLGKGAEGYYESVLR